ncbi:Uncharacterised protein [Salmonella enterica subsp. enterica serovar Typhi]|nr:Uncharacterised protein [Salmonella enterica subsp. enterica serovar Typhi]
MTAAKDDRRPPLPGMLQRVIDNQNIVCGGFLPFITLRMNAATRQTGLNKLAQRSIAHRQPTAGSGESFHALFHRVLRAIKRDAQRKLASHARLRIDGNIAVHHADQFFANRQPQTGPLKVTLYAGSHLEEGIEQANHLFCRNTNPGIPHANAEIIPITAHMQHDAANIGKLNGVAQQV